MAKQTEMVPDMGINRIVEGTSIEGEIRCESNIRIDGSFVGNLSTKGRLVIGPAGRIEGIVNCQNAEIEGLVKGKLYVQQMLSLKGTAKVEGDIHHQTLSITEGAVFDGRVRRPKDVSELQPILDPTHYEGAAAGGGDSLPKPPLL